MLKGQSPKIKGAIYNVSINAGDICKAVPRSMDNNGVAQVCITHDSQKRQPQFWSISKKVWPKNDPFLNNEKGEKSTIPKYSTPPSPN